MTPTPSEQAPTIVRATPQRTALKRRAAPTPRIPELMTWVVLSGKPNREAIWMTVAAEVSAAKPWMGSRRTSRVPIV